MYLAENVAKYVLFIAFRAEYNWVRDSHFSPDLLLNEGIMNEALNLPYGHINRNKLIFFHIYSIINICLTNAYPKKHFH